MLHDYFYWVQNSWGADKTPDGRSYSLMLEGSWNFWGLLEGTHLLMLMLFFGTMIIVDLRLIGILFRSVPVSVISKRLLPLTIFSMVIMLVSGVVLFFAKPENYYHSLWFRAKMVLLVLAMINIWTFHNLVEKSQHEWDTAASPPTKAKISGILSLVAWILVIAAGRFIAYNKYDCGKPQPDWINAVAECKTSSKGIMRLDDLNAAQPPAAASAAQSGTPAAAPSSGLPELPASTPGAAPAAAPSPGLPPLPALPAATPEAK